MKPAVLKQIESLQHILLGITIGVAFCVILINFLTWVVYEGL